MSIDLTEKPSPIVFMGCPEFAVPSLKLLLTDKEFDVRAVFTMPDRPKGRGGKLAMTPVKSLALQNNIPVFTPISFKKEPQAIELLQQLQPDFLVVVAYGLILPANVLAIPKIAPVNLHASLLPKFRGPSPIHYAILEGETVTGNTVMIMNEKMDEGDIVDFETIPIAEDETTGSLHDRLSQSGAVLLVKALKALKAGKAIRTPQKSEHASYTKKILPETAKIDWKEPAEKLERLIRAMFPSPGAWFEFKNERFKVGKATIGGRIEGYLPGTITSIIPEIGMQVVCGENTSLVLQRIQRAGKSMLSVEEFIRGNRDFKEGLILQN